MEKEKEWKAEDKKFLKLLSKQSCKSLRKRASEVVLEAWLETAVEYSEMGGSGGGVEDLVITDDSIIKNVRQEGEEVPKYTKKKKTVETEEYFGDAEEPNETQKISKDVKMKPWEVDIKP